MISLISKDFRYYRHWINAKFYQLSHIKEVTLYQTDLIKILYCHIVCVATFQNKSCPVYSPFLGLVVYMYTHMIHCTYVVLVYPVTTVTTLWYVTLEVDLYRKQQLFGQMMLIDHHTAFYIIIKLYDLCQRKPTLIMLSSAN